MNKGLTLSSGSHVLFLNAGDIALEPFIAWFIQCGHDADVYYGDVLLNNRDKVYKAKRFCKINLLIWSTRTVCHQSIIIRVSLLESFPSRLKLKGELHSYYQILNQNPTIRRFSGPASIFLIGGKGEVNLFANILETLQVQIIYWKALAILSFPILVYKYIRFKLRY
jgi:hypothetical protein